jgi:signal transduction histidine kinase
VETVAPLFTALVALSMAISTLIRGARERIHQEYAYLAGVISIVFLCLFFLILSDESAWQYALMISALLVAPASLQVFGQILAQYDPPFRHFVPVLYLLAGVQVVVIALMGPDSAFVVGANATLVFGGLLIQILWVYRLSRQLDRRIESARVGYLLWSGAFAVGAMGLEMAFIDWNIYRGLSEGEQVLFPPFGSLATAAWIYFLGQIIQRDRLLDRDEIISRIVVFLVMVMVVGAVYGVLVRLVGQPGGPFAEAVNILIASIMVLILYEPVKLAMENAVARVFARERAEHLAALAALKRRIPALIELRSLLDAIFDGSLFVGRLDLMSIYLYDEGRDGYRLRRWQGEPEQALMPAIAPRPFTDGMQEGRARYLLEELEGQAGRFVQRPDWLEGVVATMQALQSDLCLPLRTGATILGFWNLRLRPATQPFSEEELEALQELGDQLAVMIDNSRAFDRMKERDRLAALGEMSAGLAHEIRNPLGAIKGATQVLARSAEGRSEREVEFFGIIVEEVDRLDSVVRQFLDYARPMRMETEELPPDVLLAGILAMAEAQGLPAGIEVVYEPEPDLPAVPMDVEKLKQVLLNAFRNGVDAMRGSGGKLTVRSAHLDGGQRSRRINSLRQRAPGTEVRIKRGHLRTASCVEISFEDQGIGINAKDAPNLFIPFFTTKAGGTGLGLAISERIVRLHGGEIEIESVRGEGTRFSVRLPVR